MEILIKNLKFFSIYLKYFLSMLSLYKYFNNLHELVSKFQHILFLSFIKLLNIHFC